MARLAIVISAVDRIELLEGTLVSVLENRPADCEIVAALNEPYSDPYDLKDEVRFVQSAPGTSAIDCIQRALAATRAPFVHLLSSGCTVTDGWTELPLARFGDRQVGAVAPLVMDAEHHDRIFAAGLGYRPSGRRYLVNRGRTQLASDAACSMVGACGFAAFYRKAALDLVGGPSPQLGAAQADVDLALTLAKAGFTCVLEPQSRVFAANDVDAKGESAYAKALHDERLFWRNLPASRRLRAMVQHAALVGVELLAGFPRPRMLAQLAARVWACCQVGSYVRHHRMVAELGQRSLRARAGREVRLDRPHSAPNQTTGAHAAARSH